MQEVKLLPCPFCGGEGYTFPSKYADVVLWNTRCLKCYAAFDGFKNGAESQVAWNTRVAHDAAIAALEAKVATLR